MNLEIDIEKIADEVIEENNTETEMLPEFVKKETVRLIKDEMEEFEYQIQNRGKDYFKNGKVKSLAKSGNTYIAKVSGTTDYDVKVSVDVDDEYVHYECDCPYEWPCKHEYAVMLAILNKEYSEVELKPEIEKKTLTIEELIKLIPAEDLKNYIITSLLTRDVRFEKDSIEEKFAKYIPIQSYEYYYNKLYNSIILDYNYDFILSEYIKNIKSLLNAKKYVEVFSIIKAIIEVSNDTKQLEKWDKLNELFPLIGMNLRIVYRKSSDDQKSIINKWIEKLESNDYYENIYLEDIVLTIK